MTGRLWPSAILGAAVCAAVLVASCIPNPHGPEPLLISGYVLNESGSTVKVEFSWTGGIQSLELSGHTKVHVGSVGTDAGADVFSASCAPVGAVRLSPELDTVRVGTDGLVTAVNHRIYASATASETSVDLFAGAGVRVCPTPTS